MKAREVRFGVMCTATYTATLQVPEEIGDDQILSYIREHLNEANMESESLEWLGDCEPEEAVTEEDVYNISDYHEVDSEEEEDLLQ